MRLIKLMAYLLFGYALYEFVRGVVEEPEPAQPARRSPQPGNTARKQSGKSRSARQTPAAPH